MKALVVFYSRTNVTRKVAEDIAGRLKCDIEEIIDLKDRSGARGNLIACNDAATRKLTQIEPVRFDPSAYDLIIIGTPVWAFTLSCAVRTYININKDKFKQVAFFVTQGGIGDKMTFLDMENLCAKSPKAVLSLRTKEVLKGDYSCKVQEFISKF